MGMWNVIAKSRKGGKIRRGAKQGNEQKNVLVGEVRKDPRVRVAHIPFDCEHAERSGVWGGDGEDRSCAREGWVVNHMRKKQIH